VVDFYDDSLLWSYISAFLILRAIFLLISIGLVVLRAKDENRGYIGEVAVLWLSTTWISTVILGTRKSITASSCMYLLTPTQLSQPEPLSIFTNLRSTDQRSRLWRW
jgi:hypothetical protein